MKILVAGGAGYVGSALVPELLDRGYEVDVMDVFWFGNHLPKQARIVKKDLLECEKADLEGYEQIICLSGVSNDPMAEYSPSKNFVLNGALPSYLAYRAKEAGVKRLIYASSCSVYGYTIDKLLEEDSPAVSAYPYGISKLQGEFGALQLCDSEFSVISLRKGTISGHSPRMRFDLIVNTMFKTAMKDGKIIINNPAIWRPILAIRDAVDGYLRALQASYSISGVFNIASDNFTVGYVGDAIKREVEKHTGKKINTEIKNISDFRNYKVSIEKAKTVLGFHPHFSIEDIIEELFAHVSEYGTFEDDNFYNIRVFKKM